MKNGMTNRSVQAQPSNYVDIVQHHVDPPLFQTDLVAPLDKRQKMEYDMTVLYEVAFKNRKIPDNEDLESYFPEKDDDWNQMYHSADGYRVTPLFCLIKLIGQIYTCDIDKITNKKDASAARVLKRLMQNDRCHLQWNVQSTPNTEHGLTTPLLMLIHGVRYDMCFTILMQLIQNRNVYLDWNGHLPQNTLKTALIVLMEQLHRENYGYNTVRILKQLLDLDVSLDWNVCITNKVHQYGSTPLYMLASAAHRHCFREDYIEVFKILLKKKGRLNWNTAVPKHSGHKTPLFHLIMASTNQKFVPILEEVVRDCFEKDPNFNLECEKLLSNDDKSFMKAKPVFTNIVAAIKCGKKSRAAQHFLATDTVEERKMKKENNKARREDLLKLIEAALSLSPSDGGEIIRREAAVLYIYGKKANPANANLPEHQWLGELSGSPEVIRKMLDTCRDERKLAKENERLRKLKIGQLF